jgi:hypothetical protein
LLFFTEFIEDGLESFNSDFETAPPFRLSRENLLNFPGVLPEFYKKTPLADLIN